MRTNGPWKIKDSQEKYKNPWIRVREDQVIRPDGKDGIFWIVEMTPWVSIIAIDEQGYIHLTKEFRYGIESESIEVVSGWIDQHELALDAAKRELQEELGLIAEEWIDLGRVDPFTSVVVSPAQIYLARTLRNVADNREGTEVIESMHVPLPEAVNMVMESQITHGPSCVAILKASAFLGNK